ncbi:MAG: plastocyanin/azurin family copper-binding protein [Acidimicrobiia bacterium]
MRARILLLVAVVAMVGLTACGSDSKSASGTDVVDLRGRATGGQYPSVTVVVKDNNFTPQNIRIDPGVTVIWKNEGRSQHNVQPADANQPFFGDKPFGVTQADFGPGKEYSFRFDKPGTYAYYCSLHGAPTQGMIGTVIVGSGGGGRTAGGQTGGTRSGTIKVPGDEKTIQAAVNSAKPGALILVAPGVYNEAVTITGDHPNIVIRGEDRTTTILDGQFSEDPGKENGFKVLADGVAIENITARNFKSNGFFWTGVQGYRGSYLTAIRNGDYGIYAFDSTYGVFDHNYAAGSPDAGFYIGQCYECHAVMTDNEAEWNGLGYSGTNAGGDLIITKSWFHDNRAGIVPNSGTGEANPPQRGTTIVGNVVNDNNNANTSAIDIAKLAIGNGILLAGGNDNTVSKNLVFNHDISGIAAIPLPEKLTQPDNPKAQNFDARNNRMTNNVVKASKEFDLGIVTSIENANDAGGNCASDNVFTTSLPANIEQVAPCNGSPTGTFQTDIARFAGLLGADKPAAVDYKTVALPDPPALPNMPDPLNAKPVPATKDRVIKIDIAAVVVPTATPR